MEIPKPVDINALSSLLAKSKKVMNVVESKSPIKHNNQHENKDTESSTELYNEKDEREPLYQNYEYNTTQKQQFIQSESTDYTEEQVMNSKLPQNIKEAMIKNRIPKVSVPPSRITAEDISRLTGVPIRKPKEQINENHSKQQNSDVITINRVDLQKMINESINVFFKERYNKMITEEAIKKTINLLIKEGKLTTKKKQL